MRIAVDIDSTLHHYWDQGTPVARFTGWTGLRPEQNYACIAETHTDKHVLAAKPYPGAVETIRAWHADGHFIQISSHRVEEAYEPTKRWLDGIGLPYDELHCSIMHPWNRDLCEEEDVVCAPDWPTLAQKLEPVLA